MEPLMDNAADRKSVRRKEKDSRIADRQRGEMILSIMSTMPGRAWLWDRLSETSIFHTTHVTGDALASAFQEGRRSVGLSLLADIMAYCPDQYIQAMREANERYHSHNASASPADAERRGSPIGDGGDSGASADSSTGSSEDADDTASAEPRWNPGADIYVEASGEAR
jgi:hypothetical protein